MTNPLEGILLLPVHSDEVCYIWDANYDMIADDRGHDNGELELAACAAALNHAYHQLPKIAATESLKAAGIKLPVRRGGDLDLDIIDASGRGILRIRGWGRLQYLGEKEGIAAQDTIASCFVSALNALT